MEIKITLYTRVINYIWYLFQIERLNINVEEKNIFDVSIWGNPYLSPIWSGSGRAGSGFWVRIYLCYKVWKLSQQEQHMYIYMIEIFRKFMFNVCTVILYNQNYIYVLYYILNWFLKTKVFVSFLYKTKNNFNNI